MSTQTPDRPDQPERPGLLGRLDDVDYPAYTTGQAAQVLGVQQAFLRALDAAGAISPGRSGGGHRRYSRRQLAFAERIRAEFDQGHTLAATLRILALQDELAQAQALIASLRDQLNARDQGGSAAARGAASVKDAGQQGEETAGNRQ